MAAFQDADAFRIDVNDSQSTETLKNNSTNKQDRGNTNDYTKQTSTEIIKTISSNAEVKGKYAITVFTCLRNRNANVLDGF